MSRSSPRFRPELLRANSSSSSLSGMEISASTSSPRKAKAKKTGTHHHAKPLPPSPTLQVPSNMSSRASSTASSRTPSIASLSSVYTEDIPQTPKYVAFKRETILPSPQAAYEPTKYRSSTTSVPDPVPLRPKPRRDAKTQAVLQNPSAVKKGPPDSLFSEWRAPRYDDEDDDEISGIPAPVKILAEKNREMKQIAEQHAADYKLILPRSSSLQTVGPESDDGEPYYDIGHSLPAPMSPRITDVVDETLVPRPLRLSTALDSRTSSHFSSSSDEVVALREDNGDSFKSRAKKAFHSRKLSEEKSAKKRSAPTKSSKSSMTDNRGNVKSMTPSERASIQRGIIDMYDTLTTLSRFASPTSPAPPPQPKPQIGVPAPNAMANYSDHQSPAFPLTPYPISPHSSWGQWSQQSESPTESTPKFSHFSQSSDGSSFSGSHSYRSSAETKQMKNPSLSRDQESSNIKGSMGGKWKKAVGLDSKKGKKGDSEKRRESMKRKIVIVRPVT